MDSDVAKYCFHGIGIAVSGAEAVRTAIRSRLEPFSVDELQEDHIRFEYRSVGVSDDHVVTPDRHALDDILERDLVALRNPFADDRSAGRAHACRQPEIVRHDRDVVVAMDADQARRIDGDIGAQRGFSGHSFSLLVIAALQ